MKRRMMYGLEINAPAKSPEKRKRKSVSDMLKFAVASAASAAVIAAVFFCAAASTIVRYIISCIKK